MKVLRLFTIIKDPQINMKYLYHGNGLNTEHMKLSRYGNHKETIKLIKYILHVSSISWKNNKEKNPENPLKRKTNTILNGI